MFGRMGGGYDGRWRRGSGRYSTGPPPGPPGRRGCRLQAEAGQSARGGTTLSEGRRRGAAGRVGIAGTARRARRVRLFDSQPDARRNHASRRRRWSGRRGGSRRDRRRCSRLFRGNQRGLWLDSCGLRGFGDGYGQRVLRFNRLFLDRLQPAALRRTTARRMSLPLRARHSARPASRS